MGVNIYSNRSGYPSRCKWYKAEYVENNELKPNAKCNGVFYCKDVVQSSERYEQSYGVTGHIAKSVTIQTPDNVIGITINDYVEYERTLYRIASIPESDDKGEMKAYSSRPTTLTTLELMR